MAMASTTSISGSNSGLQVVQNSGHITAHFSASSEQFEILANRACLQDLQTTNPRHDKDRIEMEKGGLLKDAYNWILDHADFKQWRYEQQSQLFWIKGDPGKGKTMLLCGIIDELTRSASNNFNVAFFFCQATDVRINHATAVLRGLIFMLVDQQPSLISHIRRQYDKAGKQIFEGVNAWEAVSEILIGILEDPLLQITYLIIDALDECITDQSRFIELVAQKSSAYAHVKWVVSSRNWPAIEEILDAAPQKTKLQLELNETSVAKAVTTFIDYKVQKLTEKKKYSHEIRDAVSKYLLSNAHGTFLWVALVCEKLADISKRNVRKKLKEFPSGLDKLYEGMLDQISKSDDAELCKSLLSIIMTVYRPITLDELASCIELSEEITDDLDLKEIIRLCGSFLTLRGRTISIVHQSAKDFLLRRAVNDIFPEGEDKIHHSIFSNSLRALSKMLQRDIYSLVSPGYPIGQVSQPDPDPLAAVRYACVYWVHHLLECPFSKEINGGLHDSGLVSHFFRKDFLHWLEALSLSRSLPDGVASMLKLQSAIEKVKDARLVNTVQDACRFIRQYKIAAENYPLQLYASGLIFSPANSATSIQFEAQEPGWIIRKPAIEADWSSCLQTLEGHSDWVNSVCFSHDSKLLASTCNSTIKVWDASNGKCLKTLDDHSNLVRSVSFSHDSKLLASGSEDYTIKMWDTSSGQCLRTLKGHNSQVKLVIFSHNSQLLASTCNSTTKVWDASSGKCLESIEDHINSIVSINFSHDSKLLLLALSNANVKIWDIGSAQYLRIIESHTGLVHSATFSHDSKLLASAPDDSTIKVWDAMSGQCLQTLKGYNSWIIFSYDSKLLASASLEGNIKVWDVESGQCSQTIEGHSGWVLSVIFSYNSELLASASSSGTVKIWDIRSGKCLHTLKGHSGDILSIAFSHNSKLLASASFDRTIKVWDVSSPNYLETIENHVSSVNSVTFSPDSKLLASASSDSTVKVWDVSSRQCLHTLEGHVRSVYSVTFSHDSRLLASASLDSTVKVWDASVGKCLQNLKGHSRSVTSATFSHDSKLLASASGDHTIKIWDINNEKSLQTLVNHSNSVCSVNFSHDSKLLVSGSKDYTIKIWETSSGQCLRTLRDHNNQIGSVIFSHDSKLLASTCDSSIKVWDASSGKCLQTLEVRGVKSVKSFDMTKSYLETDIGTVCLCLFSDKGPAETDPEAPRFQGYGISSDNTCITWNSENLLWLPSEYRPNAFAVSLSTICLGCASGRVLLFTFDSSKIPHVLAGAESLKIKYTYRPINKLLFT